MSRRCNCFDNAVADVFDCIEMFYNRIRRHSHLDRMSPIDFEQAALTPA